MLGGFLGATIVVTGWISADFGSLDAMRELIISFTGIVTGAQLFFGGFVLSIVSGNRRHHALAEAQNAEGRQVSRHQPKTLGT